MSRIPYALRRKQRLLRQGAIAAAILATVALGAVWLTGGFSDQPAETGVAAAPEIDPIGLAILPFRNGSANPDDAWLSVSLAEMLRSSVGQADALRTVPTDRVRQMLSDLRLTADSTLDGATLSRVGNFTNADLVLTGSFTRLGGRIQIDGTLHDLESGTTTPVTAQADSEEALRDAIAELASSIRNNLDLSADAIRSLEAASFTPPDSMEALRSYSEGLLALRDGRALEALDLFQRAVDADPDFAHGYSALAETYSDLGRDAEAEGASRTAVDLSADLPEYEQLLIEARHSRFLGDLQGAISLYEQLRESAPNDVDIRLALAELYENTGALERAQGELQEVVDDDPRHLEALVSLGRVQVKAGNAQGAIAPLNTALSLTADNDEGRARVLFALAMAHAGIGESEEALSRFEETLALNRELGQTRLTASALSEIGKIQQGLGSYDEAEASLQEAYELRQELGDRSGIAISLIDLGNLYREQGRRDQALRSYSDSLVIQRDLGNRLDEALCLNNIGVIHMDQGEYNSALTNLEQALRIREDLDSPGELGETLHNLGETTTALGRFDDALSHYLRALEQWRTVEDPVGIAAAHHGMGTIYGYQGRFGAALQAHQEGLDTLQEAGVGGYWLFVVSSGHGKALAQAGRFDDAAASLQAAFDLASGTGNPTFIAQAQNLLGELERLRGDEAAARELLTEARDNASAGGDRQAALVARLQLARLALRDGSASTVIADLAEAAAAAEALGLGYLTTEAQLLHARALFETGETEAAQRALRAPRNAAERRGRELRVLQAEALLLQARIDEAAGNEDAAARSYAGVVRLLEEIRDEAGDDDPLRRTDLRALHETASAATAS